MLVYFISWKYDSKLGKGNGKLKNSDQVIYGTVLCRNSHQALSCLEWMFRQVHSISGVSFDDGEISCKRTSVDSRNLNITYLMLEDMKEPLYLPTISSNYRRLSSIFQIPRY